MDNLAYNNLYNEGGEGFVPGEEIKIDPIRTLRNRLAKAQRHLDDMDDGDNGYVMAQERVESCRQAMLAATN